MNSVGATGGLLDMTYSRFSCLFLFNGVLVVRGIGRLFGRGSMNFVGATHGRPRSAIGFSFYCLLPFSMKKRATDGRPERCGVLRGSGRVDCHAGDGWSPLQKVIVFFLRVCFCRGNDRLRRLRQMFFFGQRHRLFA